MPNAVSLYGLIYSHPCFGVFVEVGNYDWCEVMCRRRIDCRFVCLCGWMI